MFNSQRGLSFDPAKAREQREERALREAVRQRKLNLAQVRERERQARSLANREYARFLDQVEACYRERARDRRHSS